jgi:hypothetical protein
VSKFAGKEVNILAKETPEQRERRLKQKGHNDGQRNKYDPPHGGMLQRFLSPPEPQKGRDRDTYKEAWKKGHKNR